MYMQAFPTNLQVGSFFVDGTASPDFRANNAEFAKIVRLCGMENLAFTICVLF